MAAPASPPLPVTDRQYRLLKGFVSRYDSPQQMVKRVTVILRASAGESNYSTYRLTGMAVKLVKIWRDRWKASYGDLCVYEQGEGGVSVSDRSLLARMLEVLGDLPRSGAPPSFTDSQKQQIVALACQSPSDHGLPLSRWTHETLARQAKLIGIVDSISPSHLGEILKNTPVTAS